MSYSSKSHLQTTIPDLIPVETSLVSTSETSCHITQPEHSYLEFFAGSGLVAAGLQTAFKAIWANDIDSKKRAVYTANHSSAHFHLGSIADIHGKDLPNAALAWASFPCQDLSLAGQSSGINGARSGLVWQWLRIIDEMSEAPPILVAENVLGLVSAAGGEHYRALHAALSNRGYRVGAMLLDAIRFVPQSRPRIFIVAARNDIKIPDELISSVPIWAHSDAVQKAASGLKDFVWWKLPEPPVRKIGLSDIVEFDAEYASFESEIRNKNLISENHARRLENVSSKERFVAPGYKRTRNGKQVLELRFDNVAGCLRTPTGGSSRQLLVIRTNGNIKSRLLTIRETARLMGAPENYKIPGSYNDGYKAMGDAVAVPVANWLAMNLLLPLANSSMPLGNKKDSE